MIQMMKMIEGMLESAEQALANLEGIAYKV